MKLKRSDLLTIKRRACLLTVATLALGVSGCAADRHKEVKRAETTLTSARQEAQQDAVRLRDKQIREQAEAQKMTTAERAELTAKQIEERADTTAESTKKIAEAEKDVVAARAAMREERIATEADAKARLRKADARFLEAHGKSAALSGKERTRYDDNVHLYAVKRAEAEQKISELTRAPDEGFARAKDEVDDTLDELERFADRINDDL